MKYVFLIFFTLAGCSGGILKYNYASSDARIHCAADCPGRDCLCILGANKTWYLNPEIGDEK